MNGCTDKLSLNAGSVIVGIVRLRARVSHIVCHVF